MGIINTKIRIEVSSGEEREERNQKEAAGAFNFVCNVLFVKETKQKPEVYIYDKMLQFHKPEGCYMGVVYIMLSDFL